MQMIQVAVNGSRMDEVVPKTSESVIQSTLLAVEKGATSVHVHPRDNEGHETLKGEHINAQIAALSTNLKDTPIGISTGEWIEPDVDKRLRQIKSWENLPDFVSINFHESGSEKVADLICAKNIKIEAGLSDIKSTRNFIKNADSWDVLRILIEPPEQDLHLALQTIDQIEALLKNSKNEKPILLHGIDATCWSMLQTAIERNYQARIGFEDTLVLPDGNLARSNAELVEFANQIRASVKKI